MYGGAGMLTKRFAPDTRGEEREPNLGCAIIDEPLSDITRLARNAVFWYGTISAVPSRGLYLFCVGEPRTAFVFR